MVSGMPVSPKEAFDWNCQGWAIGEQHCQLISKKTRNNTNKMLELTRSSIFGFMKVDSGGGLRHFMSFIVDYLQSISIYTIKQKSEAFTKVKEFLKLFDNQTGLKMKQFRCNSRREYVSVELFNYCRSHGILREPSISYFPQEDVVLERITIHSWRWQDSIWPEGVPTAVYLPKRSPTVQ